MTTIKDKIEQCKNNKTLYLFKEGFFYKCYNEDALLFIDKIKKNYKKKVSYQKKMNLSYCSIGFPISLISNDNILLNQINETFDVEDVISEDNYIVFNFKKEIDKSNYTNELLSLFANHKESEKKSQTNNNLSIEENILSFDIANSCPIDCMLFIQKLKNIISK